MKKLFLLCFLGSFVMAHAQTHWTPSTGFQYTMSVTGVIIIDGVEQTSTDLEIGAFCGDQCRGAKKAGFFPPTSQYTVPISIAGNTGDLITFRIYDHAQDLELDLESVTTLTFEIDAIIGTIGNWFQFSFVTPEPPAFHFTTAGNWSTASNWQGGVLPGANDEVFIDAACQLDQDATVAALTVTDGQSLTLQSGKTLTVSGTLANTNASGLVIKDGAQLMNASTNVSATLEKDIIAYVDPNVPDGWYTIASPMDEMEIDGSNFLTPEYDLYRYNETRIGGEWENYNFSGNVDFSTFENGRGYLYANTNTFSPTFAGTLNADDVTYPLTYTERPDALSGWNLIGNPFPHNIYKGNGGAIDNAKLASGYYTLTNEGAWHVHPYDDAIQPGQSILVKASATMDLAIAKNNATATSETNGAKAETGRISMKVSGETGTDRAFAYFTPGTGLAKLGGFSATAPMLSIQGEDGEYAIAHVGNESESLELLFANNQQGEFTLTVGCDGTDFSYLQLIDNETGIATDLLQNSSYTFQTTGQENEARFTLVFKESTGMDEHEQTSFCYFKDKMLYINSETQGTLTITDMTGRVIVCIDAINRVSTNGMAPGVYVLRLINGENVKTQKMVVN